jgi:hypothetical protein
MVSRVRTFASRIAGPPGTPPSRSEGKLGDSTVKHLARLVVLSRFSKRVVGSSSLGTPGSFSVMDAPVPAIWRQFIPYACIVGNAPDRGRSLSRPQRVNGKADHLRGQRESPMGAAARRDGSRSVGGSKMRRNHFQLVVDGSGNGYLKTVRDDVHLNRCSLIPSDRLGWSRCRTRWSSTKSI